MTYNFHCDGKRSCSNTLVDEQDCPEEKFVCNGKEEEEYVSKDVRAFKSLRISSSYTKFLNYAYFPTAKILPIVMVLFPVNDRDSRYRESRYRDWQF